MCDICTPMGLVFNYVLFLLDSCCNLGQLESLQESFMDTLLASTLWSFSASFMPPACRAVAQMRSVKISGTCLPRAREDLGCWEHPCILTSILAKENRTWICTGCLLWKPKFFSFLLFPPCKLTQWFHNFCALRKLGQKCYYSLCWLQPVISLYFMDPYIFSKNGGSAALSPHHNCRIDRWMDTVSI